MVLLNGWQTILDDDYTMIAVFIKNLQRVRISKTEFKLDGAEKSLNAIVFNHYQSFSMNLLTVIMILKI